jgi:hypothetical protein
MKNWDNEAKKEMIIKLTESIDDNQTDKFDFSKCFNAWDDERSADMIWSEIRNERINNRETEPF